MEWERIGSRRIRWPGAPGQDQKSRVGRDERFGVNSLKQFAARPYLLSHRKYLYDSPLI